MAPTIYQDSFQNARPNLTYAKVSDRLALSRAYTTDLSNYFRERAALEDSYVKSLHKLAARLHGTGSGAVMTAVEALGLERKEEERQLGAWKGVRDRLEGEVTETARVHDVWSRKVIDEVEGPLRFSLGKPDWMRYQQGEASLGATVREYDSTLDKVQKAQSKSGSKASKAATSKLLTAQSHLSTLGSNLASSLPPFLSAAQSVDDSHSAFVTESLVRYGTLESDLGRERMEAGERFLNQVLAIDRESELESWALRESMRAGGQITGGGGGGRSRSGTTDTASGPGEWGQNAEPVPPLPTRTDNEVETLRPPMPERPRVPSISRTTAPDPQSLNLPSSASVHSSSAKPSKFGLSLFKRDRSSSVKYGTLDVPTNGPSGSNAHSDRHSIESRESDGPEDATGSFSRSQARSGATLSPDRSGSGGGKKRESLMPFGGSGGLFRRPSKIAPMHEPAPAQNHMEELREVDQGAAPALTPPAAAATLDDEGYSVPPAGYDKQPWETNGGGTNLMDNDEDEPESSFAPPKPPAVAIAPTTITETDDDRQAALAHVKSTLSSMSLGTPSASPLGLGGPQTGVQRRGTARGRRDVRMTTYNPSMADDVPLAKIIEAQRQSAAAAAEHSAISRSSTLQFTSSPTGSMFPLNDRANSIVSTTSSTAHLPRIDPFEHATGPGLRASITETVNVLLKGGTITRVMVSGEISLSHRLAPGASPGELKIRIAQFEQFEKAAPNSAFLTPLGGDAPGEYILSPALSQQPGGATATVLLYQLHVPEGHESDFVPLQVKASWKCDEGLTRVIVLYQPNGTAKLARGEWSPFGEEESAKLEDVVFQVPVSVNVGTFQAKPTAVWNAERGRLVFGVEPVVLGAGGAAGAEEKLLASVTTEGTFAAVPQPIAVGWKVVGRCVSGVGVEVVGVEGGGVEDVVRATVAGKYLVAPNI